MSSDSEFDENAPDHQSGSEEHGDEANNDIKNGDNESTTWNDLVSNYVLISNKN